MRRNNSEGRGRSRDETKSFRGRKDNPATGFKKYRDADKSEAGWTKADGKPLRKRLGKKEQKSFSNANTQRREGGYSENKRKTGERKPFREKSFGGERNERSSDERRPVREKTFGDKRETGERKPFREKSFGDDRRGHSNDDRRPARDKDLRAEKKSIEEKPFGKFYKAKRSFSKNKKARSEGGSRFSDNKFSDRTPKYRDGSTEKRGYVKKVFKRPGKRERSQAAESTSTQTEGIRLNRFIANSGICSRREADELIEAGVITVNGKVVTELGTRISADDDIRYNGERMKSEKLVYLVLNKPKDYITTTDDPQERKTVMELIKSAGKERIYPVGRLDRNTTGLLMFTNDGEMTKKLTHPSSNIFKVYHVELDKPLTKEHMHAIAEGVELEDGFIKVDEIAYDDQGAGDKSMVGIELHSGKNRIVRRLFERFEYEVRKLDRVIFAGLTKKDLPRGRWRFLTEEEINMLKVMTGAGRKVKD